MCLKAHVGIQMDININVHLATLIIKASRNVLIWILVIFMKINKFDIISLNTFVNKLIEQIHQCKEPKIQENFQAKHSILQRTARWFEAGMCDVPVAVQLTIFSLHEMHFFPKTPPPKITQRLISRWLGFSRLLLNTDETWHIHSFSW